MKFIFCSLIMSIATLALAQGDAQYNPVADPAAVIIAGNARFTVLTPQLIRIEWSPTKQFEDHASMVFLNRRLPVPKFTKSSENGWLILTTDKLTLKYKPSAKEFNSQNLSVYFELDGKTITWTPGTKDTGNLLGTTRTLDGVEGSTSLEPGLVSRDGWVVVDDSTRPLFDNVNAGKNDWPWVMSRPAGKSQDLYFFGYGHDYKQGLGDYIKVAGRIPLPPRFAFGTWWSRYWAYSDQEFKELVRGFRDHEIPLDVLVIDMDWHITFDPRWWKGKDDQSGHRLGWTGYTWNKDLFPDPEAFLKWVHEQGLKTAVNLHPASGVQPHEAAYPAMARAMGIDPATKKYVPFDIASKKFTENYFKYLHRPLEKEGIDFFWLDWQQEDKTSLPGVNPTWWLNYVHTYDMETRQGKRPIIFHRWGGLGNHRYQIGFSGDTISVWKSLAFQPYFTATAANVGYAYWSHDIGGHMPGTVTPELYTRWIQFGLFSPILRTHTTKNPEAERRIWAYPPQYAKVMRDAFLLRYALIPYIYTQSRKTYDTGVAFLRPLYYDYPEAPEAYDFKDEYIFGDDMIVAPIATELNKDSQLATKSIWLPPGEWIEWFSGEHLKGPAKLDRTFALNEIPVYVRAGAIVPMQPKMDYTGQKPVDPLILTVMPGVSGHTRIYDDAGDTLGYKQNEATWTTVKQSSNANTVNVEVSPVEGSYPGMPTERAYEFRLLGVFPPKTVTVNGQPLAYTKKEGDPGWRYDSNHTSVVITTPRFKVTDRVMLAAELPQATDAQQDTLNLLPGRIARLRTAMDILNGTWQKGWSPDSLIHEFQVGDRITYDPTSAIQQVDDFAATWPRMIDDVLALQKDGIDAVAINTALTHLGIKLTMSAAK
jgi:alpha-glucosidase (family GH31 glycosyl hydrolase)